MAWMAQSKFDSYFSWDLNALDVAAGIVIIEEAGGSVCNFDGRRADITSRRYHDVPYRQEQGGGSAEG